MNESDGATGLFSIRSRIASTRCGAFDVVVAGEMLHEELVPENADHGSPFLYSARHRNEPHADELAPLDLVAPARDELEVLLDASDRHDHAPAVRELRDERARASGRARPSP